MVDVVRTSGEEIVIFVTGPTGVVLLCVEPSPTLKLELVGEATGMTVTVDVTS